MPETAREKLATLLKKHIDTPPFCVQLPPPPQFPGVWVDGVGEVALPVSTKQAEQLAALALPAKYGRGEQTLTDTSVRDTGEIPLEQVHIEWNSQLEGLLAAARDQLGLAPTGTLTAELHSMLVYGEGQFFLPHQDSEKHDEMIATLVVMLPSHHAGGELVVAHDGRTTTVKGLKTKLALVAFYPDCVHQVRPVTSGYRLTLTYNLLWRDEAGSDSATAHPELAALAGALQEHFTTRQKYRYQDELQEHPPIRLAYLLDHSYTEHGLSWSHLKGADAARATALRAAARLAGCETVLALAEIQETRDAESEDYDYWGEAVDEGIPDSDELGELIDSSLTLTFWLDDDEGHAVDLRLDEDEVCASTATVKLEPYDSQYEGYMGNYGNTMDRWYRRAVVLVWPKHLGFANRAQASPQQALESIRARLPLTPAEQEQVRVQVAGMASFWSSTVSGEHNHDALLETTLAIAVALADPELATMLAHPFTLETLKPHHTPTLNELADLFGTTWVNELLTDWFTVKFADEQRRACWLGALPELARALAEPTVAHHLITLAWQYLARTLTNHAAASRLSWRQRMLTGSAPPFAALLETCAVLNASQLRESILEFCRQQPDLTTFAVPALRTLAELPTELRQASGVAELANLCTERLRECLSQPTRAPGDWSIHLPEGCTCPLCTRLAEFLREPAQHTLEWPLAQDGRRHIHERINATELPVTHDTRRVGRPFTLVLSKSTELFDAERRARARDQESLAWLTATFPTP